MGGSKIDLISEGVTLTVPNTIKFIYETLNNPKFNEKEKIALISDKASEVKESIGFFRGSITAHVLDESEKLNKQFNDIKRINPVVKIS